MADGSIVIATELDNKDLEKQLQKMKKDIAKLEETTTDQEAKKSPLVTHAGELEQKMKAARAEVLRYREAWSAGVAGADKDQSDAAAKAQQMEAAHAKVVAQIDKIDAKLQPAYEKLDGMKRSAGGLEKELAEINGRSNLMGGAIDKAGKYMEQFSTRVKALARRVLVFSVITMAMRQMREWMAKVIKTNSEASVAVGRLKGALLTMVQPLVNVIIPAFITLVNVLTRVIAAIASAIAALSGGTVDASKKAANALNKETEALEGAGAAAENAGKSMAGFDELNTLSDNSGGGGAGALTPAFDFDTEKVGSDLNAVLNVVKLIGTALLAWKLTGSMEKLFSKEGIKKIAGAFLVMDGAIGLVKSAFDAWQNGVDWESLLSMLARTGELVLGLFLLFGPTGAAIGLIVTGLTMLATGFHDAATNGWNLENTLLSIAGILATGIGIAVLTGSWIPLLIAAIASALLALVTTFGDGEKLIADAKQVLQGFLDFFVGVFTGDIDRAIRGIGEVFDGLRGIFGNVIGSIKSAFSSFLDWLDEKTGGKFSNIIQFMKDLIGGSIDWVGDALNAFLDAFQAVLGGLVKFISGVFSGDWDKAWEGLCDIGKGAVNLLLALIESFVNFFINGLNTLIKAMNKISFTAPDWVPVIGGKSYGVNIAQIPKLQIPRLATGAVIPPNREFMAVLGDQRNGMNIEAPENLIRKIVREESGGGGAIVPELREILSAIREGQVLMVDKKVLGRTVQTALSESARAGATPIAVR